MVEENPFNSNETPLVEVVTNSKERRVKLFIYIYFFALKAISKCMYSISAVLDDSIILLRWNPSGNWVILAFRGEKPCTRILKNRLLSSVDFSRAIDVMSYLQ